VSGGTTSEAVRPGRIIDGRYELVETLGAGGMGVVARAHDQRLGRDVALKLISPALLGDAQARARLLREARAMAAFTHAHVAHVYDAGPTDDGGAFLAMELVVGSTARALVGATEAEWPLTARLVALANVARALAAAHAAGIVHRDVKPDNLILRPDGGLVLLDFGIAHLVATAGGASSTTGAFTGPNTVLGTLAYVSPEQAYGDALDGRSDQFAFAVTAYELLTGAHPWPAEAQPAILAGILTAPAPRLADRCAVPPALDDVLARALEKDRDARFPTMDAFASAFEAAVGLARRSIAPISLPASGRSSGATAPAPRALAFARTEAGAVATAPSAPAAATAPSEIVAPSAPVPPPAAAAPPVVPPSRASRPRALLAAAAIVACAVVALGVRAARRDGPQPTAAASASASASSAPAKSPRAARAALLASGTDSAEARAAFVAALEAWWDGNRPLSEAELERASRLDPHFGAAPLWRAAQPGWMGRPDHGRADFRRATASRSTLEGPNRALYDALVPCLLADPVDRPGCLAKLDAAADAWPDVADLRYFAAGFRSAERGPSDRVVAEMDRVLAIDPAYGPALFTKAQTLAYLGRSDEALAAATACIERLPSSSLCLAQRGRILDHRDDCAGGVADMRRLRVVSPDNQHALFALSAASLGAGEPIEVAAELWRQIAAREPEATRPLAEARARVYERVLRGDLAQATRTIDDAEPLVTARADRAVALYWRRLAVEVALEAGDRDRARRIAEDTLRREGGWPRPGLVEDRAIAEDRLPFFADVAERAGAKDAQPVERFRAQWIAAWRERQPDPFFGPFLWLGAYAAAPPDEGEAARAALLALPTGGFPPYYQDAGNEVDEGIGRIELAAGHASNALRYLRRAATGCRVRPTSWLPVPFVRASLHLGRALEATGDRAGACAAYEGVVARWGRATPRSVTAEAARAASAKLGCGK
jgi:serine/threonine-protein kinase